MLSLTPALVPNTDAALLECFAQSPHWVINVIVLTASSCYIRVHTIIGNGVPTQLTEAVKNSIIKKGMIEAESTGERFSLVGKKAATALDSIDDGDRMQRLGQALEMEGKTKQAIWAATGWERGTKGKSTDAEFTVFDREKIGSGLSLSSIHTVTRAIPISS